LILELLSTGNLDHTTRALEEFIELLILRQKFRGQAPEVPTRASELT
jgi:hypothetical protein